MKYNKKLEQINLPTVLAEFNCDPKALVERVENIYQNKISHVCDQIIQKHSNIVLLTGPSSSGKTTTAIKLVNELEQRGKRVYRVSLDNFYLPHDQIPNWSDGQLNFETIEALDVTFFNQKIYELITNQTAEFPLYDFATASRREMTFTVNYDKETFVIFEGIHALNPLLCQHLNGETIMRIYVSVHSDFVDDEGKIIIRSKNLRLMRRLIRDYSHRKIPVEETLNLWIYVLRGEQMYIKPFRNFADIHINSVHAFEPLVYQDDIQMLLSDYEDHEDFRDLVNVLFDAAKNLPSLPDELIPANSLIREFI